MKSNQKTGRFVQRRSLVGASLFLTLSSVVGCASIFQSDPPKIDKDPSPGLTPILKPKQIHKAAVAPRFVVDVHAHFFNARDVPIKGFLSGPLAHAQGGLIGELLKALAPIAQWIGNTAPDASDEFRQLEALARAPGIAALNQFEIAAQLQKNRDDYLGDLSSRLHQQLQGAPEFVRLYNSAQLELKRRPEFSGQLANPLDENSLLRAMQRDKMGMGPTLQSFGVDDPPPYTDGVLAFVGYMLSYRWMNLIAYQHAFSSGPDAFGVDHVLGALVDFDHWLSPPPKTAHQDQIKLHQLLSELSDGYMRPIVAYNPWSDVISKGECLNRALDAIDRRGFVGVKIYPPNGYKPFGNILTPGIPSAPGMPTPAQLDEALLKLWTECGSRNVPIMAHSADSMGSDDSHDALAGPAGWQALINTIGWKTPARVNLAHFGGDSGRDDWNAELTRLMASPQGAALYGDLGYWDGLRCGKAKKACVAREKLAKSIKEFPVVADRLMYGSDWLMLSAERRWDRFPFDVLAALPDGFNSDAVFGRNAKKCFSTLRFDT